MTFEELLRKKEEDGYAAGLAQGIAKGCAANQAKMLRLIQLMADNGEADLIPRLSTESQFLDEMYRKYQLS